MGNFILTGEAFSEKRQQRLRNNFSAMVIIDIPHVLTAGAVTAWLGRADQLLDVTGVGLSSRLPRAFSITSCNCPLANRRWFPTTLIVLGKPSMSGTIRYLNPYPD